nr:hypothetical protein [Amycolatopsis thermoflava]
MHLLRPSDRNLVQSVNATLNLTAAIWHNRATGQPTTGSLIAYDH